MSDSGDKERRRSRRRQLPFMRSAVLEVAGRSHIVAVTDLGPDGAFLSTKVAVKPDVEAQLRVVIPRDGREAVLPCRVVWRSDRFDAKSGRPAGVAVRFEELSDPVVRRIEEFATEGFLPDGEPSPPDHFEYRLIERTAVDVDELNRLGRDGWALTTTLPAQSGFLMVFLRRL
jgi:hypothetical protein